MDIIEILTLVIRESATAALALFAIWSLKVSYERRLEDSKEYAQTLKEVNDTLIVKLTESTAAQAASVEVIRRNSV
ncbi:hypothetical protein LCGC14_2662440 [marine sediment metagenome]|uniref:Uncharacterized protein n=1 Tax=marine sediment metagenome TaxID=412755 RepID=A0A0F9ADX5_9ZZZZ